MAISDTEATKRARAAFPHADEAWIDVAAKMEHVIDGLDVLERDRAQMDKLVETYTASARRTDRLVKAIQVERRERAQARRRDQEIAKLEAVLRKAEAFRKSADLTKLSWPDRWKIDSAERGGRAHLAKLRSEQKRSRARSPSDAPIKGAESRHAMLARGVTFDRMM